MFCYLESENEDPLFWITKREFEIYISQKDFIENRDQKDVENKFSEDCFDSKDKRIFFPASVAILREDRTTQFINGRHRTAVLLKFIDPIPLGFVVSAHRRCPSGYMDGEEYALSLGLSPIMPGSIIELPDLPIKHSNELGIIKK